MVDELENDDNEGGPDDVVVHDDNVERKRTNNNPDNDRKVADEGDDHRSLADSHTYLSYL